MEYSELEEIDEELGGHWQERMGEDIYEFISPIWNGYILPSLKARALAGNWTAEQFRERYIRAIGRTEDLLDVLRINQGSRLFSAKEQQLRFWEHQKFDFLRAGDDKRGIQIDRAGLLRVAADYLSHPEIYTNKFDWVLLDGMVFAELDSFAAQTISSKASTGMAAALADGSQPKYFAILALLKVIGFAFGFLTLPVLAGYAFSNNHDTIGTSLLGLWGIGLVWSLIALPFRWKARRKTETLLSRMNEVYNLLGDSTISPRLLKDALDKAAAAGVVFDGAVFSIVDRVIARDATAFVPGQIG